METICQDLAAEHEALDTLVDGLSEQEWDQATPAAGWSVRDQISHLWFFDQRALMALVDPDAFARDMEVLLASGGTDLSVEPGRALSGPALLAEWRRDRQQLLARARTLDPSSRVPWYGPAMGARSFLTARLMETWAHGYDVADALGVVPEPTARLKHVAHIGVRARPFSYVVRGRALPDVDIYVELEAPDGSTWTWSEVSAENAVSGPALDFCLLVTQRRHLNDVGLTVVGEAAAEWLSIAQAFAGPPGDGRPPLRAG